MLTNQFNLAQIPPRTPRCGGPVCWVAAVIAGGLALCWALFLRDPPGSLQNRSTPPVATVEVDRGDVSLVVTENGFLESSVDDVERCRVESILGLPAGLPLSGGERRPTPPATARSGGGSFSSRSKETALTVVTRALAGAKHPSAGLHGGARARAWIRSCREMARQRPRPPWHPRIQPQCSTHRPRSNGRRSAALITQSSPTFPFVPLSPTRV